LVLIFSVYLLHKATASRPSTHLLFDPASPTFNSLNSSSSSSSSINSHVQNIHQTHPDPIPNPYSHILFLPILLLGIGVAMYGWKITDSSIFILQGGLPGGGYVWLIPVLVLSVEVYAAKMMQDVERDVRGLETFRYNYKGA